jgi:hypothetical protein
LIGAKEDVASEGADAERFGFPLQIAIDLVHFENWTEEG